jgi:hypothetical protein
VAKKKQRIQTLRREQARLIKERQRITEPWRLAIFKLREQLEEECLSHPTERRRFQHCRLIDNFIAQTEASPITADLMSYWLFCGSPWQDQLGYDQAQQQHYAELKALGLCREFQPQLRKANIEQVMIELFIRLDSLAAWIEAQESWVFWKRLNKEPAVWDRDDPQGRRQAFDAELLARLPTVTDGISDWLIAEIVGNFRTWTKPQWVKILKLATRAAERGEEVITDLDRWVWWRYPIFSRYRWSAAEVCRAARQKFGDIDHVNNEAAFQSAWVRRGLRFTGKRRRRRCPLLWDFVINEQVPRNVSSKIPLLAWISYEKSPSRS